MKITFEPFGEQIKLIVEHNGKIDKIICKNPKEASKKAEDILKNGISKNK